MESSSIILTEKISYFAFFYFLSSEGCICKPTANMLMTDVQTNLIKVHECFCVDRCVEEIVSETFQSKQESWTIYKNKCCRL